MSKPAFYVHFIRPDYRVCNPDPEENSEVRELGEGSVVLVFDQDTKIRARFEYDTNWPDLPAWIRAIPCAYSLSVSPNAWGNLQEWGEDFDAFTHETE